MHWATCQAMMVGSHGAALAEYDTSNSPPRQARAQTASVRVHVSVTFWTPRFRRDRFLDNAPAELVAYTTLAFRQVDSGSARPNDGWSIVGKRTQLDYSQPRWNYNAVATNDAVLLGSEKERETYSRQIASLRWIRSIP